MSASGRAAALSARLGWLLLGVLLLALLGAAIVAGPSRLGMDLVLVRPLSPLDQVSQAADHLWPLHGASVLNALAFAGAAILAARALSRRLGGAAPLWVAAWIFGSAAFAYVLQPGGDLLLLAAVAAGFALVYWDESGSGPAARGPLPEIYEGELTASPRAFLARWLGAGALLALAGATHPLYLLLLIPAFLAPPPARRQRAWLGLGLGAALIFGAAFLVARQTGGWGWLSGLRPEPAILDLRLLGWNALDFLAGRDLGVLPYFLPLLLALVAAGRERGRWAILAAVLAASLGFLLLRPFDFSLVGDGGAALGNRAFLPLYAALWFVAARPARPAWALLVVLLAAPFLYPLWLHPKVDPETGGWPPRVAGLARRALPYETTQAALPGAQERSHDRLHTRLLSPALGRIGEAESLRGDATGELLVASRQPLEGLLLPCDPRAPTRLLANGEELRPSLLRPDGGVVFAVPLAAPRRVHPTAWSRGVDVSFYRVLLRLPGAAPVDIGFRVLPQETRLQDVSPPP